MSTYSDKIEAAKVARDALDELITDGDSSANMCEVSAPAPKRPEKGDIVLYGDWPAIVIKVWSSPPDYLCDLVVFEAGAGRYVSKADRGWNFDQWHNRLGD